MIRDQVSILIATRNRSSDLRKTLTQLRARMDELPGSLACEVWVVDNASTDDTREMVLGEFGWVKLVVNKINGGPVAKNVALKRSRGEWVMFLDDDSSPVEGSIQRAVAHLQRNATWGCVSFDVILPDGTHEASAYPDVFIGCGAMFRREALEKTGGLPDGFFMQAEEYDLSLRLMNAGYRVRRCVDCVVEHRKTKQSRSAWRTTRLDVRNNLLVLARNIPAERMVDVASGWLKRYWWMSRMQNRRGAFLCGVVQGVVQGVWEMLKNRRGVSQDVADRFFMTQEIRGALAKVVRKPTVRVYAGELQVPTGGEGEIRPTRVAVLGLGKNAVEVIRVARDMGMEVVAVVDDAMAKACGGSEFAGVPVVSKAGLEAMRLDVAVVGHASPVLAMQVESEMKEELRKHRLRLQPVVVINVLDERTASSDEISSSDQTSSSDAVRAEAESRQTVARSVSRAA
jgi:GT2 family glycosyltransferase